MSTMKKMKGNRPRSGSDMKHDRQGLKGLRGKTKKNGGGGHYTWGLPGDEIKNEVFLDKKDPNYDSEGTEEEDIYLQENHVQKIMHDFSNLNATPETIKQPLLSLPTFKSNIRKDIEEFFISEEYEEFFRGIVSHDCTIFHYEIVKNIIQKSMEKSDRERELASQVLSKMQMRGILSTNQCAKGFERLLENVDDIELDVPKAKVFLSQFLARAVADDVIPPAFLVDKYIAKLNEPVVMNSKLLLSVKHGLGKLEFVWNYNVSSPVEDLKRAIKMLLQEFVISADVPEAISLIKELNVPYFHHEVIKRGVIVSMEAENSNQAQALMSHLFKMLFVEAVVSTQQMLVGFQRIYQELHDIQLDNPDAKVIVEVFAKQAVSDGFFSQAELDEAKRKADKLAKLLLEDLQRVTKEASSRTRASSH